MVGSAPSSVNLSYSPLKLSKIYSESEKLQAKGLPPPIKAIETAWNCVHRIWGWKEGKQCKKGPDIQLAHLVPSTDDASLS